nr:hypothetical protein [Flavobacterium sp.]
FEENHQIKINVVGITNSREMKIFDNPESDFDLNNSFNTNLQKSDLKEFINSISSKNLPNLVFVDNTSSEDVVAE